MAKSLKMVFAVGDAKTATRSLAEPKDGLTKAEVQTALDEMVAKQAITVGGAPITQSFCNSIGADAYAPDAATGAEAAIRLLGEMEG